MATQKKDERGHAYHNGTRVAYMRHEDDQECVHLIDGSEPCSRCHERGVRERVKFARPVYTPDFNDGLSRGVASGQLYAAVKILGDVEGNAVLTKRQASRVLSAAAIVNDIYTELWTGMKTRGGRR